MSDLSETTLLVFPRGGSNFDTVSKYNRSIIFSLLCWQLNNLKLMIKNNESVVCCLLSFYLFIYLYGQKHVLIIFRTE